MGLVRAALDDDELQGRLGDREVGVAGAALGRALARTAAQRRRPSLRGRRRGARAGLGTWRVPPRAGCSPARLIRDFFNQIPPDSLRAAGRYVKLKTCLIQALGRAAGIADRTRPTLSAVRRWCASRCRRAGARDLALLFKALADPVRLRLLSLIACHEGGESWVCDLTGPFDDDRADGQPPPADLARGGADQLGAARDVGVPGCCSGADGSAVGVLVP